MGYNYFSLRCLSKVLGNRTKAQKLGSLRGIIGLISFLNLRR